MLNFENKKGITLIALVITIIVLLILAGVSIATLTGNNGVITQSVKAKTEDTHSQLLEEMQLETQSYQIEVSTGKFEGTLIDYLNRNSDKPIVNNDGVINVKNLLGKTLPLGNGTSKETGDVYVLEEELNMADGNDYKEMAEIADLSDIKIAETVNAKKKYIVVYYGKSREENANLGNLIDENFSYEKSNLEYEYIYIINNKGELDLSPCYSYYLFTPTTPTTVLLYSKNGNKLTNIKLEIPSWINGKKVTTISNLNYIKDLQAVKIPNTVTTIDNFAFSNSGIKELYIPKTVKSIKQYAFQSCKSLTTIYYEGSEAEWNAIEIDATNNSQLAKINVLYNQTENKITESAVESTEKREDMDEYWAYACDILKSLSQEEIKDLYYEGELYWAKEYYEQEFPGQEITKELMAEAHGYSSYEELLEKIALKYSSLEEALIDLKYVKPAGYFEE